MIEAIRAAPGDDELRLVYADALEQQGESERAELIRLQLEGADTLREKELRMKARVAGVIGEYANDWTYERGLISKIEVACDVLLEHGDAMFAAAPIRALSVYMPRERDDHDLDLEAIADALATRAWLRHLESVEIPAYNRFAKREVARRFLCSPHLAGLRVLRVGGPDTALASDGALGGVCALHVSCEASTHGDALLAAWAERSYRLVRLEMAGCGCTVESVRAIARAQWKLEHLVFAGTHYQDDMIGADGSTTAAGISRMPAHVTVIAPHCSKQ